MKMKFNFTLIFLGIFATPLFAQTYLPASLPCSKTLTLAESPYIVDSTITILSGCILTVEPGVEIKMAENTSLIINGIANFLGTESQKILIHALNTNSTWGHIIVENTTSSQKSIFNYVNIENATHGPNPDGLSTNYQEAAISGYHSALEINNCFFKNNKSSISIYQCKKVKIKNCTFDSTNVGEKIHGQWTDSAMVDHCIFYFTHGSGDAIDFDAATNTTITNNRFYGGDSDGIDIGQVDSNGCDGVLMRGNYIYNMGDKGITCGEWCLNLNIDHNLIVACNTGIGSKAGSFVVADHNTLYGNQVGVRSYDHLDGWGSGHLTLTNSIIAGGDSAWYQNNSSVLLISNSLSDTELMSGTGNIYNNPLLVVPTLNPSGDFHLTSLSPAIDAGNSSFPLDPDGSRTDLGAFFYDKTLSVESNITVKDELDIYPNPTKGNITISISGSFEKQQMAIRNFLGQIVYSNNKIVHMLDISFLPAGVYFLQITDGKKTQIKKIIKY